MVDLDSMASGVIAIDPEIMAIARPGASLVSRARVAYSNTHIWIYCFTGCCERVCIFKVDIYMYIPQE